MNISVQAVHFNVDSKLTAFIEKRLQRLQKFFDRNDVKIEVSLKLQDTGGMIKQKVTEIHLHLPGGWLVDKKADQSFESAIVASIETLRRQLVRRKEKGAVYRREDY